MECPQRERNNHSYKINMNDIFMVHVHIQNVSLSRDQEQKVNCF